MTNGVAYYEKVSQIVEHFEDEKEDLMSKLEYLTKLLFRKRMNDIQDAVLALLVPVGLKCEYKCFSEHGIVLLDDLVIKIGCMRIGIV